MNASVPEPERQSQAIEQRITALLEQMTLHEKVGQMTQLNAGAGFEAYMMADRLRAGGVGSVLNTESAGIVNELQRIAVEESRLGIPLLIGRDVIHGFETVMPIPLGQAASWNTDLVKAGARQAALEAVLAGVNWTFAPMIDVSRDPRWGRIAESLGEDPYLTSELGAAMVAGFQGDSLADAGTIAACAKHFAGYGAVESGRDYATTNVSENEMRNVYLRPFLAAASAGVATFMTSFSDIDGVPATANGYLLRQVLRDEWGFDGLVVSDYDSVRQLKIHGLTDSDSASAAEAAIAGVDMEMEGGSYAAHLPMLVEHGEIDAELIDVAVSNILRTKFRLGLFDDPYTTTGAAFDVSTADALAKKAALESAVLLTNRDQLLPLDVSSLSSIAVIGPMADAPYEQLGTWIFDGDVSRSITPRRAIEDRVGVGATVNYCRAMENSRSLDTAPFAKALDIASAADVTLLFLGEESILSGEAHCRADIDLPGAQIELVRQLRKRSRRVVAVILAGRPLTLTNIVDEVDAILYAWHPGTMGGPAIADLLFGDASPSGKLPVSFPKMVGQIPIYYGQKNTGKPPSPDTVVHIDEIDAGAAQTSIGMTAFHLDAGYTPLFEFGFGLSYTTFDYSDLHCADEFMMGETLTISARLTNSGRVAAEEIAQLYIRDLVGNVTRPVRELKGFQRIRLQPGETKDVQFELHSDDLAFYGRDKRLRSEAGEFHAWIGGSSGTNLRTRFRLLNNV